MDTGVKIGMLPLEYLFWILYNKVLMVQDFMNVLQWWAVLFAVGIAFLPLTYILFNSSKDKFYIFSKVLGIGIVSYVLLVFGTLRVLPFSTLSVFGVLIISFLVNIYIYRKVLQKPKLKTSKIIIFEEFLFLLCLTAWSFVRGFEPNINGLEKFMDFGFVNSILRAEYFPPRDMWFTPFSINYYFFGHLTTAVLTKLSGLNPNITYNLMMATLFAFCAIGGFSLVFNFLSEKGIKRAVVGGLLGGTLISLSGNLHTVYSFFQSYVGEKPVPFWTLTFLPNLFPNGYWYPNATRFIPFTIHEFPLYSFVVSDLHGHVLDIPFVLLTIALLYTMIKEKTISKVTMCTTTLFLAIMYMTNVWDSAIYMLLMFFVLFFVLRTHIKVTFFKTRSYAFLPRIKSIHGLKTFLSKFIKIAGVSILLFILFTLPFSISFKPFVSGIGVVCPPDVLTNVKIQKTLGGEFIPGKIGPLLFEKDHCQRSPFYQLIILYGFFVFFAASFLAVFLKTVKHTYKNTPNFTTSIFIVFLIILSAVLIIVPEFFYAKDIYPQHYRANTMFKLVYQSFMILSLVSAYTIVFIMSQKAKGFFEVIGRMLFITLSLLLLTLVLLYPYFAIPSYYGGLNWADNKHTLEYIQTLSNSYKGLNGIHYLKDLHPGDYETIQFINATIPNQPVILEAQGDSYTDYARISANTGLPTVLGWTVHEWLWRGSYDIPSPRIDEVRRLYENHVNTTRDLIKKYNIQYVYIGKLEREKYQLLNEKKFETLGRKIFTSTDNTSTLYKIRE